MTHKEMTKHLRGRLARAGVPCRVRMNGAGCIQVITPTYERRWSPEELKQIALVAKCNGLTFVRQMDVHDDAVIQQLTAATQFDFYME